MPLKKVYLSPIPAWFERRLDGPTESILAVVPPRGHIFLGGQPNTSFCCKRVLVVGESVRATHLFIPDPQAPEGGFHRAIDVSSINEMSKIQFDPATEPVVRVQNDSDIPQPVSVSLIGPSTHRDSQPYLRSLTEDEKKLVESMHYYLDPNMPLPLMFARNTEAYVNADHGREYMHTLWQTDTLSLDLHKPRRIELEPESIRHAKRDERIKKIKDAGQTPSPGMYSDDTSFTVQPPVRGRAVRLHAKSNSKMDIIVDSVQCANINYMIGVSGPIEIFQGEGLALKMGVLDAANRITVSMTNTSEEPRWVELYVELDTDVPPFKAIQSDAS